MKQLARKVNTKFCMSVKQRGEGASEVSGQILLSVTKLIFGRPLSMNKLNPHCKACLARPISLPHTLNFSCEIFVKQQKETIELLFGDTYTAMQEIWM